MTALRRWPAAALFGALSSVAQAQTARPPRPEPLPERPFKFPHIETHTLANGLRLLVVEDHSLPLVAVRAVLPIDSTADPPGREGLYAVTLGAMREGTTTRTADQLADAFAELGRTVTPTGFTALAGSFGRGLELMSDMLLHPAFDSAGVERRKALQAGAATRQAQAPVTAPRQIFYAELYGADDGYARSLHPTAASIGMITPADVAEFYARHFGPVGTTIVVTGDVSDRDALAAATRLFGSWRTAPVAAEERPAPRPARETTIYLHGARSSQTYLFIGGPGPARTERAAVATDVMSAVAASRMQQTLRDKRSFMYSGTMGVIWQRPPRAAVLVGSTVVSAAKVDSALAEWVSLLRGLSTVAPPTPAELDAARRLRVGSLPARMDGPDSLASRLVELARDALPVAYFDRYVASVEQVTAAELTAAASKYLDVNHLIIVVSGDRTLLEPALRAANLGPVVVVDSAGRRLAP
jgi:zinc protease